MQSGSEFINYQRALAQQKSRDDARVQAAYNEAGLNGRAIAWHYWVHLMPVLNAMQAACLMSALDPDVFANLNERPGKTDPAKNIEKAKKIQRLAEAQGKLTASPAEWLEWAQSQSAKVHPGFLLAVGELPTSTGGSGDTAVKVEAVKRSITKGAVINAFEGLHFDRNGWNNALSDVPKWIEPCRVALGRKGDKTNPATWNPVLIAHALLGKNITIKKLDAVFVSLTDWVDEWQETSANDR